MYGDITTVGELLAALVGYDPRHPDSVRSQRRHPSRAVHTLADVVRTPGDPGDGTVPTGTPVAWLCLGQQVSHLSTYTADALGW